MHTRTRTCRTYITEPFFHIFTVLSLLALSEATDSLRSFRLKEENDRSAAADLADLRALSKENAGEIVQSVLVKLLRRNAVLLAKACLVTFFAAEILAFFGFIGNKGEGLYRWAIENKALRSKVLDEGPKIGWKIGRALRQKTEDLLQDFVTLAPRAKFASAVSLGVMTFPLFAKTSIVIIKVVLGGYIFAEALALAGVIGKRGEFLSGYLKDGEHEELMAKCQRVLDQQRLLFRKKLRVQEFINRVKEWLGDDKIFWAGFGLGTLASLCITDDENIRI